jgi:hypothetical protein
VSAHAVLAALILGAWIWAVGGALVRGPSVAERIAAGAIAACALGWAAMAAGAVGIGLLGSTAVTAGIGLLVAAAAVLRRRPALGGIRPAVVPVVVLVIAAAAMLTAPALHLSLLDIRASHGDMIWHSGWIDQLRGGASAPGGLYAGEPNGYPWLFHAIVAWLAAALPGTVNDSFQVVQLFGIATGAAGVWLLARVSGAGLSASTWAVAMFLTAGAFGWAPDARADFAFQMPALSLGPFHGDPVPAMTPALTLLAPMVPRDLGLTLSPLLLWAALAAAQTGRRRAWWGVGSLGGVIFLVAPPAGIFCALWTAGIVAVHRAWGAWRALVTSALTASVWIVPLGLAYRRYHGFVPLTEIKQVEPSAAQALIALGVAVPLGIAGLAILFRRRSPAAIDLAVMVAIPAVAVLLGATVGQADAFIRHGGPTPLVRWLRYLPFIGLALCVPAGVAAHALVSAFGRRSRLVAAVAAALLALVVAGSTTLASASLWRSPYPTTLRCTRLPIDAGTRVAVIARQTLGGPMASAIFARTGATFSYVETERLRVRFRTWLATRTPSQDTRHAWLRRALAGGPAPPDADVLVVKRRKDIPRRGQLLGRCRWNGEDWDIDGARAGGSSQGG